MCSFMAQCPRGHTMREVGPRSPEQKMLLSYELLLWSHLFCFVLQDVLWVDIGHLHIYITICLIKDILFLLSSQLWKTQNRDIIQILKMKILVQRSSEICIQWIICWIKIYQQHAAVLQARLLLISTYVISTGKNTFIVIALLMQYGSPHS